MEEQEKIHNYVLENEPNITQVVAYKNGLLVYADNWHDFKQSDTMNVMSVTKSVMSILVGIAIDQGYINNADDKVLDYFPHYTVKRGEKTIKDITIRHLLTMTAPYKYKSEPWTKVCTSDDWTKAALDNLGGKAGITGEFKYATLGIQILSGIIANASQMNPLDFANKYLFQPLGIAPRRNAGCITKEDQLAYLMSKKPHGDVWFMGPEEIPTAGWGLSLSALDMAKIGQMCLSRGLFDNQRIVSEKWIDEMTTSYQKLGDQYGNQSYGFLWWLPHQDQDVFAAIGDGGNVIYVNKKKNVSVGVTATFKPRVFDRVEFIEKVVLPLL